MPSAANASLQFEANQIPSPMGLLTDSGDHKTFTSSAALWSQFEGNAPDVRPNGVINGGDVTPATAATDNTVDVSALLCYLAGIQTSVAASLAVTASRGATTDTHRITSITVTSAGAIAAVAGTQSTAFVETRGAAGGPPFIPVGSVELAQVRLTSITDAPVADAEIFDQVGTHRERYDYPAWVEQPESARLVFNTALPLSHTGDTSKRVYASYSDVVFAEIRKSSAFVPPEESFSSSSVNTYFGETEASESKTLNQGSFTALLKDGISDSIVPLVGKRLWFKFKSDQNKIPYVLCNGVLGMTRSFPVDGNISASFTISPRSKAVNRVV